MGKGAWGQRHGGNGMGATALCKGKGAWGVQVVAAKAPVDECGDGRRPDPFLGRVFEQELRRVAGAPVEQGHLELAGARVGVVATVSHHAFRPEDARLDLFP